MRGIDRLRIEAEHSLRHRGHTKPNPGDWQHVIDRRGKQPRHLWRYLCPACGLEVAIDTRPPANGIDIGGPAVARGCDPRGW